MAANAFVRARVTTDLRDEAAEVLKELGLTVSDVMRMMLTRIAREKAIPIELMAPNAVTCAAIDEARAMREARKHRFENAQDLFDAIEEEVRS